MKIEKQSVELLRITPDAELLIECAARTCYASQKMIGENSAQPLIQKLLRHSPPHESVIEHASATFLVVCDRGISHEIVRHRLGSYSQQSTRYCNYNSGKFSNQITVIKPPDLTFEQEEVWKCACKKAESHYLDLISMNCEPQIARSVLPICLKTEIVITYNFRMWRHFIKMRLNKKAHPQIQQIAQDILHKLVFNAYSCFGDLTNGK